MVLKWWGTEGGRSPSAGSLSIRPGRICRFTGPPQNPNTATFLISQGSRAAAPQHDPPQQSQHPGCATAHSEKKEQRQGGGHPSAALHTGLGRRSKPKPGVILTQRQSAKRQPGQPRQLGPPHSRENRGKKRRRGWGNISDVASHLGLARHAQPGSILYASWVNKMSLARARLDPASGSGWFVFRAVIWPARKPL